MIGKIIHFIKRKDWRGFPILKKAVILGLYALKPLYTWKKYPDLTLQALELDRNDLCINHGQINNIFDIKYGNGTKVLMTLREMINIYRLVDKTLELPGDLAEVGVYQGGSAKIICEAKGNKPLHLFDTFEGLPSPDETIDKLVKGDMHNTSLELVKHNLNGYEDVNYYKGYFPDTAGPVKDKSFSFVNLDTDIYESTKSCLEFFYPRMEKQGVLLTHDYNDTRTPGVKKAFDEYFGSKPEYVIELWDTQAMIIKS